MESVRWGGQSAAFVQVVPLNALYFDSKNVRLMEECQFGLIENELDDFLL